MIWHSTAACIQLFISMPQAWGLLSDLTEGVHQAGAFVTWQSLLSLLRQPKSDLGLLSMLTMMISAACSAAAHVICP